MKPDNNATQFVMNEVSWGRPDVLFTPAYWVVQVNHWGKRLKPQMHRLGRSLKEEAVACMLGGHGIPSEVALAAFHRLRQARLLEAPKQDTAEIIRALSNPLDLGDGRRLRYRFAKMKGTYVGDLLQQWSNPSPQLNGRAARDWLLQFRGIGPKTASWIVRNWFDSDDVAILDIHIHRAGILAGFYSKNDRVERDYARMEERFLQFAQAIGARPSILDAIIWFQMKQAGRLVHHAISRYHVPAGPLLTAA